MCFEALKKKRVTAGFADLKKDLSREFCDPLHT